MRRTTLLRWLLATGFVGAVTACASAVPEGQDAVAAGGASGAEGVVEGAQGAQGEGGADGAGGSASGGGGEGASMGAAAGGGAGQFGGAGQAGGGPVVCVPGAVMACACAGSTVKGAQTCLPDGTGLGSCEGCPVGMGAGGSGAGQGGTAGGAGQSAGEGQGGAGAAAGAGAGVGGGAGTGGGPPFGGSSGVGPGGTSGTAANGGTGGTGANGGTGGTGANGGTGGTGANGGTGGTGGGPFGGSGGATGGTSGATGAGECASTEVVTAPGVITGSTSGGAMGVQIDPTSTCWAGTYGFTQGSERTYRVELPAQATLVASVVASSFSGSGDVSIAIVSACIDDPSLGYCTPGYGLCVANASCLAADHGKTPSVSFKNPGVMAAPVWVVIDGHSAAKGSFSLDLSW